jgi:serine/threonine protein kinase
MKNIEHKQQAVRRSSSYKRINDPIMPSPGNADTKTLFSRNALPGDMADVTKFIFDDFKILKLVGRGTFGKVYLVKN